MKNLRIGLLTLVAWMPLALAVGAPAAGVSRRVGPVPGRSGSALLQRKVGRVARPDTHPVRSVLNAQSFGADARPVNRSRGLAAVANAGAQVDRSPATRGAARAYLPPSSNVTARLPPVATGLRPAVNHATLGGPAVGPTHSLAIGGSQLRHKL